MKPNFHHYNERVRGALLTAPHTVAGCCPGILVRNMPDVTPFTGRASRPLEALSGAQGKTSGKARLRLLWECGPPRERRVPRALDRAFKRRAQM